MNQVELVVRKMRLLHPVFLVSVLLYLLVLLLVHPDERAIQPVVLLAFALVCAANVGIAMVTRTRFIGAPAEALRRSPEDIRSLLRWQVGNVVCFVFAESVALLGFTLRILGASWQGRGTSL